MATTYATFSDFTAVHSIRGTSQAELSSYWLPYGGLRVNESLGRCFTTPFSSNNETAKDLNIQFSYLGILLRTTNQEDSEELKDDIILRVTDICCGNAPMILSSGDSLFAGGGDGKFNAFSTTDDFKNTFDMREAFEQRIDPDLIDELWDEDIS